MDNRDVPRSSRGVRWSDNRDLPSLLWSREGFAGVCDGDGSDITQAMLRRLIREPGPKIRITDYERPRRPYQTSCGVGMPGDASTALGRRRGPLSRRLSRSRAVFPLYFPHLTPARSVSVVWARCAPESHPFSHMTRLIYEQDWSLSPGDLAGGALIRAGNRSTRSCPAS